MEAALREAEKRGWTVVYPSRWDRLPAEIQNIIFGQAGPLDAQRKRMSLVLEDIVDPYGRAQDLRETCRDFLVDGPWTDNYDVNDPRVLLGLRRDPAAEYQALFGSRSRSRQSWPSWIVTLDNNDGYPVKLHRCVCCGVLKHERLFRTATIIGSYRGALCRPCCRLFRPMTHGLAIGIDGTDAPDIVVDGGSRVCIIGEFYDRSAHHGRGVVERAFGKTTACALSVAAFTD